MARTPKTSSAADLTRVAADKAAPVVAASPDAGAAVLKAVVDTAPTVPVVAASSPVVTLNEVADHPADPAPEPAPAQKGIGDEMSEFLEMLESDVLRAIHGLQANAEDLSRRLAVAGEMAAHSAMSEVANVVGEFRNGLQRIMAPKS